MPSLVRLSLSVVVVLAALAFALLPLPAAARDCARAAAASSASASVAPWSFSADAGAPIAVVNGGGPAVLTDPSGVTYPLQFGLAGRVAGDGAATGRISFVFRGAFAAAWGAVPGTDTILLTGTITTGAVASDGTITLAGTLTDAEYAAGQGLVFTSEHEPFQIVTGGSYGTNAFAFQFCALPTFHVQVLGGGLRIH